MTVAAGAWADSETTSPGDETSAPARVRPVHVAEVAPTWRRIVFRMGAALGGLLIFLVFLAWLI